MPHPHEKIIHDFYTAFSGRDHAGMQRLYHESARFSDPVFTDLSAAQVQAMWEMLLRGASDLRVTFCDIKADDHSGSCRWDAFYTFSMTGRRVHNIVRAKFTFRDGRIWTHVDDFNLWRWSTMALGFKGVVLGWTPLVRNAVRATAMKKLTTFMNASRV